MNRYDDKLDAQAPHVSKRDWKVEPHSGWEAGRMTHMRGRWSRGIAVCAVALMALAGCRDEGAETANGAEGTATEAESGASSSSPEGTGESDRPRETVDPCEGRTDEFLEQIRCDVVAWADLDLDGTLEPIAVATGGEPSIELVTVIDGETLEYSATFDPDTYDRNEVGALGPNVGSMEALRHSAFVGAYDMTGDGRPELVMWADKGPYFDEFRVIRVGDDGLESLNTPLLGMHGGGKAWVHYLDPGHPGYRCTDDPDAPLEYLSRSEGTLTATRYEFDDKADEFISLDDRRPIAQWAGDVPVVGVDCTDRAQHEPEPALGPTEPCPLGQLAGTPQSGNVGAFIEGTRTAGEIGCERMATLWNEYDDAPKDPETNGKSMIVDFGSHTCSMSMTWGAEQTGRVGGCGATDKSWSFIVTPR